MLTYFFFFYADDTNIVIPLWKDGVDQSPELDSFLRWSEKNSMSCNPRKCKELTLRKKGFAEEPRNKKVTVKVKERCEVTWDRTRNL